MPGYRALERENSDTGRPHIPQYFQHHGVCDGLCGNGIGMHPTGGTSLHGMGSGVEKPLYFIWMTELHWGGIMSGYRIH